MQAYALDPQTFAPALRLVQGGKTEQPKKARALRPLKAHEAITLAWLGGLVHECMHPFSEVLIDEGSTPIEMPYGVASSAVLERLLCRGFIVSEAGLDDDTIYALTETGEAELLSQRACGHLVSIVPLEQPVRWVEKDEEAYAATSYAWAAASAEFDSSYEVDAPSPEWEIAEQDWQGC